MSLTALAMNINAIESPFIIPVAGCAMALGIVIAGVWSGVRTREIQSTERLAAIAKGVPVPPTIEELAVIHGTPAGDTTRKRDNIRRGGIVLLGVAAGLVAFFIMLWMILHVRGLLAGAAGGLIPLSIGIALLIDARIQTRELEVAASSEKPLVPPLN